MAEMTVSPSQVPKPHMAVALTARLWYDWIGKRQRWDYFDINTGKSVGGEMWIGKTLYEIGPGPNPSCYPVSMSIGILMPWWLNSTTYTDTFYLLQQAGIAPPPLASSSTEIVQPAAAYPGYSNYTSADLWQEPAPIGGTTNSWIVADSKIGEPVRLVGPDDSAQPTWLGILEYSKFQPATSPFPESIFALPKSCGSTVHRSSSTNNATVFTRLAGTFPRRWLRANSAP